MNLPNKLTVARMFMVPIFVAITYLLPEGYARYVAVAIFIIASLTDWLDGYIARKLNLVTTFGKYMDPLADKVLVAAALIYLVERGLVFGWIVVVIIAREFLVSGLRIIAIDKGIIIAASYWGKIKTAVTMIMIIVVMLEFEYVGKAIIENVLIYGSMALTLISAVDYTIKNIQVFKD